MTGRDMQLGPDAEADRPSEGLSTADLAGVESATQATTADEPETETPAPPEQRLEPQSRAPAPTADQPARPAQTEEESRTPLFAADAAESFRSRWQDIQTSFIDEPTRAVEQADSLVAEIMQQLAKTFADERAHLEEQGEHGKDISTEDLRMALRHYRSFFDRLLSI
ncbi:MAG: hypothetical protein MUQ32_16185 [Chloroflexi bacterium]|nr:hypothetical protein [Chloroflexota bacterium]